MPLDFHYDLLQIQLGMTHHMSVIDVAYDEPGDRSKDTLGPEPKSLSCGRGLNDVEWHIKT